MKKIYFKQNSIKHIKCEQNHQTFILLKQFKKRSNLNNLDSEKCIENVFILSKTLYLT